MRRFHPNLAGVIVLTVMLTGNWTPSEPHTVLTSQGSDGCNPSRQPATYGQNFDGWDTYGLGTLGGATVAANTYSPYVESSSDAYAWSMLTDSVRYFAQVGYLEAPGNTGGGNGTAGTEREFFAEYGDNTSLPFQVFPAPSTGLPSTPYLEDTYIYNTLYDTNPNDPTYQELQFQIGAPGHTAADVYYMGMPLPPVRISWVPNQAQIDAEVHSLNSQMPGDIYNPLTLSSSGFYYTGGSPGWRVMDQGTGNTYKGPATNTQSMPTSEYAYRENSNNSLAIWDLGCPPSVSSGAQIPVNYIFDAAGTGTQKTLQSDGPTLTNGPYVLTAQAGGNLVLSDGNNEALWSPQQVSASNYLVMQNDDNLVLYNGAGGAALWNSHTGGSGYSNPYAIVQNDGNFVVYGTAGHYLWQSSTGWDSTNSGLFYGHSMVEGQSIYSPNNGYRLYLGTDCNFMLLNSSNQVVWATWTGGLGSACHADMQTDGNFVLYRYAGPNGVLWSSGTGGTGAWNHMVVGSSGTFSVYDLTGAVHYTS